MSVHNKVCNYVFKILIFILIHVVFNDSIAPIIYENIKMKVSKNGNEREQVEEFMKQIKLQRVVENLDLIPRY